MNSKLYIAVPSVIERRPLRPRHLRLNRTTSKRKGGRPGNTKPQNRLDNGKMTRLSANLVLLQAIRDCTYYDKLCACDETCSGECSCKDVQAARAARVFQASHDPTRSRV